MLLFNIPDAFEYDSKVSQGRWGVGGVGGSRHTQNNAWDAQYGVATVNGSTPLSVYAKTFSFISNIKNIDAGRIKVGAYMDNTFHNNYRVDTAAIF